MANDTQAQPSFLEKLGDRFNRMTEGVVNLLGRFFGSSNDRQVLAIGYELVKNGDPPYRVVPGSILEKVNALEEQMKALSDAELKEQSDKFRQRLKDGETVDRLLPEAFAACREAGRRTKGMRHYDVQIVGGTVLHRGNIAEMVTGEGKTLVATLPAYLNALTGEGVHVITVNDYLARRDCEWMLPIYQALGVTAGYIQSHMEGELRRRAYDCDITYGTNSEFGFDYLRDNMKPARRGDANFEPHYQQAQRGLNYAIIDEVDNILIDEARTPLIISGPAFTDVRRYEAADRIAKQLSQMQKSEPGKYFEVKEKEHTCHLTDEGIREAEKQAGVESFYTPGNMEWPHMIDNALKAHHLYQKDKKYMVTMHEGKKSIIIIDEFTGRPMFGRQWSDGLHQAVEAKHRGEGVVIQEETQTLATVTLQNYFKLYKKLSGMTGTAMTEANEFWKIYKLDVVAIPTNRPLRRVNHSDMIFRTEREKFNAIADEVIAVHNEGRPILIGTTDVAKSERISDTLKRRGVKHQLLNAKPEYVEKESEVVAQAGRRGAVTIATNMAGRGTDIILGGNPETLAWNELKQKKDADGFPLYPTRLEVPDDVWGETVKRIASKDKMKEEGEAIKQLGGLHIVGTDRHESRRIDNQLRGRAGRQGDPGSSRFILSLEDDLLRIFAGDKVRAMLGWLGMQEGEAIESGMITRQIGKAQKKVEEYHFDQRKNLLEYDEVMDHQRKTVYGTRQRVLDGMNCKAYILSMIGEQIDDAAKRFLDDEYGPSAFAEFVRNRLGEEFDAGDFRGMDFAAADSFAKDRAGRMIPTHVQESLDENMNPDTEQSEWRWKEFARAMSVRFGLSLTDAELKKVGYDDLAEHVTRQAEAKLREVDLSDGRVYLEADWGLLSLADWVRQKFNLEIAAEELDGKEPRELSEAIYAKVEALYRERDVQFPVLVAMSSYMNERNVPATPNAVKYDREGLLEWAKARFPGTADDAAPEQFRTLSRSQCKEKVLEMSLSFYPEADQSEIDGRVEQALAGTHAAEEDDAKELAEWAKATFNLDVPAGDLVGLDEEAARDRLWNAFDHRYRPEMRSMERTLILDTLDTSWKSHLLVMDHLRSGIGLVGYAQIDPKTEYKRQGMREFDSMLDAMNDRTTEMVFRMEESASDQAMQDSLWAGQSAQHAEAESYQTTAVHSQQQAGDGEPKKVETIRNTKKRLGRNEPCHCGSGKKYKNCHMRQDMAKV